MLRGLSSVLTFIEDRAGGMLLLISSLLIVGQTLMRAVFGYGISGIYEVATFCMIWSVILTAGAGIRRNVHVRVDILIRLVPAPVAFWMEVVICLVMAAIGAALVYSGVLLVQESLVFGDSTLGTIRIPMWIPQSIMPLGGALVMIRSIARIVALAQGKVAVLEEHDVVPTA
ncbi:hypothetical protein DLJ53_10980 [Acuticoccus sediminis]|uniref:TRAP transporter small permease protein n=1 Tax=Acuticoccus sediminis TaxID=2184697 RepID=A0A8B2NTS6_9HYPH|nr:TRAP transporter small permease [Acuticoccus sediminis]RAI01909.1 hypothetical protein DLJ53_10980 [Acuticoccus sediminis]